jgi:hypothetical protein
MQYAKSGLNSAAEYQISALPYATSSIAVASDTTLIEFPYVTKFFNVQNTGTNYLYIGFTKNGAKGGQRFSIAPSGSFEDDFRVKDLFLISATGSTTFEIVAGLTMIERRQFPTLTGSAAPGVAAASSNSDDFGYNGLG